MGYEEFLFSALSRGRPYEQLPATLQSIISYEDYQQRVKEYHIARGAEWAGSPAQQACGEAEYYDSLVKAYKAWLRVRTAASQLAPRWSPHPLPHHPASQGNARAAVLRFGAPRCVARPAGVPLPPGRLRVPGHARHAVQVLL